MIDPHARDSGSCMFIRSCIVDRHSDVILTSVSRHSDVSLTSFRYTGSTGSDRYRKYNQSVKVPGSTGLVKVPGSTGR